MSSSSSTLFQHEIADSDHWLFPDDLLTLLDVRPGMVVAEIGAGRAFYAIPIGRRVGQAGNVFAVEWRPWLMEELEVRLSDHAPDNVKRVEGRAAGTHLRPRVAIS